MSNRTSHQFLRAFIAATCGFAHVQWAVAQTQPSPSAPPPSTSFPAPTPAPPGAVGGGPAASAPSAPPATAAPVPPAGTVLTPGQMDPPVSVPASPVAPVNDESNQGGQGTSGNEVTPREKVTPGGEVTPGGGVTPGADATPGGAAAPERTVSSEQAPLSASASSAPVSAEVPSDSVAPAPNGAAPEESLLWSEEGAAVDRYREVPAEYVRRSMTQAEGTFGLSFANYSAFIDATENVGWVPVFTFGVTSDFQVGVSAPLRYDEGLKEWAFLDPIPELTFHLWDSPSWEVGVKGGVILPLTSEAAASIFVGVPTLWRVTDGLRFDLTAEVASSLDKPRFTGVRLPVSATAQVTRWLFSGLGVAPSLGVAGGGKTAVDGFALVGLTLGARGRAQMDVTVRGFIENTGAGEEDRFSDGVGTIIAFGFFPDLY